MAIMRVPEKPAGNVPEYQGGKRTYVAGTGASGRLAPLSDAAARIQKDMTGAQIADFGKAVTKAAIAGETLYMDYQKTKAQEAYNKYQQEAMEKQAALESLKGSNALGEEGVQMQLGAWQKEAKARLTEDLGEPARRFFDMAAADTDARLNAWGMKKAITEEREWKDSVDKGTIATAQEQALADPSRMAESAGAIKAALEQMGKRNGWSPEFIQGKFRETERRMWKDVTTEQVTARLMQGDIDGARQVVAGIPGSGGTIAEDFKNPLNLKRPGANSGGRADFRVFGSYAEGFQGAWDQLKKYQNRDGLTTPRQMISKWAPASDGNDLGRYAATLKAAGVDPDKPLNINDPAQAARLMKGMAMAESPVGKMFSADQIRGMLSTGKMPEGWKEEQKPGRPGVMDISDLYALNRTIEIAEGKQQKEASLSLLSSITSQVQGLPLEEREAAAMDILSDVADPEVRAAAASLVGAQLKFLEAKEKAQTALAMKNFAAKVKADDVDPINAERLMDEFSIPADKREDAMKMAYGKVEETPENRAALDEIRRGIDLGEITTVQQIEVAGVNARMTDVQIKAARTYLEQGGKLKGASLSSVDTLYKKLSGQKKMPEGFYDSVVSFIPDGKVPSEVELRKIISNLIMDGHVSGAWFGDKLYEAMKDKTYGQWLPDLTDEEEEDIAQILREKGQPVTSRTMKEYKKAQIMGLPMPVEEKK